MPYTTDDEGRMNNFAVEPKMYPAEPPTLDQKKGYLLLGLTAATLVGGLLVIAAWVS
jgi:hypothetical protein